MIEGKGEREEEKTAQNEWMIVSTNQKKLERWSQK